MTDYQEVPSPDRSGSSGKQIAADDSQTFVEARPFRGLHVSTVIDGIAASNTRAFGGEVPAALIAASTRQMSEDNLELRLENRTLNGRLDAMREELHKAKTNNAVYEERIRSDGKNKNLRNLAITVGTGLVGLGITLFRSNQDGYAIGAVIAGVLLLLLGWFSGPKEDKK